MAVFGVSANGEEAFVDLLTHAEAFRVLALDAVFQRFKATVGRCTANCARVTCRFQNIVFSNF